MTGQVWKNLDRRQLLIGAGLIAAVVIPAGIYGIPRLVERPGNDADRQDPLGEDELALVAAMAEGIIPATDTPGAIGAGVPQFIALLFSEWMTADEQAGFRKGLEQFDADARGRFGNVFAKASAQQKAILLNQWDEAAAAARTSGQADLPPFARFKSITVIGYYTSKVGQEQELKATMDAGQYEPGGPVSLPMPFNI